MARSSARPKAAPLDPAACAQALEICACQNLRSAARAVTRFFDESLHPSGLRSTQFVILAAIHAEGEPSLPRLARRLVLDRSALTRSLRPLRQAGLVATRASPTGAATHVSLTNEGRDRLTSAVPLWKDAQDRFVSRLGPQAWQALRRHLPSTIQASSDD